MAEFTTLTFVLSFSTQVKTTVSPQAIDGQEARLLATSFPSNGPKSPGAHASGSKRLPTCNGSGPRMDLEREGLLQGSP